MKLFISWSGRTSQLIAAELRNWLPLILPAIEPFITTTDIDKGAQWQGTIRDELDKSNFGIVILTRENLGSQWIAFEAGALSKHLQGRVATILFDIGHSDVKAPLNIFQGTIFNEQDFRKLIADIDNAAEQRRGESQLDKVFPKLWPDLEQPIRLILQQSSSEQPAGATDEAPDPLEIAQEMMALLRQQNAVLSSPEKIADLIAERLAAAQQAALTPVEGAIRSVLSRRALEDSVLSRRAFEDSVLSSRAAGDWPTLGDVIHSSLSRRDRNPNDPTDGSKNE